MRECGPIDHLTAIRRRERAPSTTSLADLCTAAENVPAARALPSCDLLATASLRERGPDGWCKKLDHSADTILSHPQLRDELTVAAKKLNLI